jgi:hypothetical protein
MKSQGPKTKLVRVVFTREQIFQHKGEMVLEVPSTMTIDELKALDNDELNVLPWKPLSEPEYGDEPDRDMVYVETVEECPRDTTSVDGVVTVVGDGDVRIAMP